ncbi:50S ribosomal protein L10 [Candidatus Woesearchaeota archaeon]|nr:50S ribosomal protein L10 [Candidatus Woesearchaeota archaeon]
MGEKKSPERKIAQHKKDKVAALTQLLLSSPVVAAVDMENLPAPQLSQMRAQLRGKVEIFMTKRRLMKIAISSAKEKKKGVEKLVDYLRGMPAFLFTKENPFSLYKTLKKNKSKAPAKAGQTAPFDIIVPKGPTGFAPGPIIGELATASIKAGVEGGKVVIKEDSIAVKEGQKISQKTAELLSRLQIYPMEVGLNITAVLEGDSLYPSRVLDIDEVKFKADLTKAARWGFNLAFEAAYPAKENIRLLIGKAFTDAKALGVSQNILDEGIIDELLGKAERSALALKQEGNISIPEKTPAPKEPAEIPLEKKPIHAEKSEEKKEPTEQGAKQREHQGHPGRAEEKPGQHKPIQEQQAAIEEKQKPEATPPRTPPVEEKMDEPQQAPTTEEKAAMVAEDLKKQEQKQSPSAEEILEEAGEEHASGKVNISSHPKAGVPSAHELAEQKRKEKEQQSKVANLAQELLRKGTLRK